MIPTYAQSAVILRAIDSALSQDYENLEVVVSDDASPDDTKAVVAMRADPRLRYFRNSGNLGRVGNYRHTLYDLVTGDWVVNLDGDDYYTDKHFISAAIDLALTNDRVVVVAARQTIDFGWAKAESRHPEERTIEGRDLLLHLPDDRYSFNHLASLYRRRAAVGLDFYRMNVLSSDLESLLRLACEGRVSFLDRNVGVWTKHGGNASSSVDVKSLLRNLAIWPSVFEWAAKRGLPQALAAAGWRRMAAHVAYGDLYSLLKAGRLSPALEYAQCLASDYGLQVLRRSLGELFVKTSYRLARDGLSWLYRRASSS